MTASPDERSNVPTEADAESDRRYALKLIRARASCMTVMAMVGAVVVLIDLDVPLRSLQILAAGAAVTAMGFFCWADVNLPGAYKKAFGNTDDLDESKW